ncbi:hypothetical protein CCR85_13130 [Rhodothalassium salexigens]|nr:hypothetical protein [Rhodothalassium salexigens]
MNIRMSRPSRRARLRWTVLLGLLASAAVATEAAGSRAHTARTTDLDAPPPPTAEAAPSTDRAADAPLDLPAGFIGPALPRDITGGAPAATLTDAALFAWRDFLALNWPAAAGARGKARVDAPLDGGALGDDAGGLPATRVWSTFKARVETYPGQGDPFAPGAADYGAQAPPRYIYGPDAGDDPAHPGRITPCDRTADRLAVPWHNLDEPNHNNLRAGLSPEAPFPGQQVLLETKINPVGYRYVAERGWYGARSIRKAYRRTGDFIRRERRAPEPGSTDDQGRAYVVFPDQSMMLKAGWRRLGAQDDPARFLIERVRYYEPRGDGVCYRDSDPAGVGGDQAGGGNARDHWGLLAFHITHKTPSAPYFIWATFEHVDALVRNRPAGSPVETLETPAGGRTRPVERVYTPALEVVAAATKDSEQHVRVRGSDPAPAGQALYFIQEARHGVPGVERVAVEARLFETPAEIRAVNRAVQARLAAAYPASPLSHYRLVSVQWVPVDKPVPGRPYTDGAVDPAVYYAANVVLEPQPVHQAFSGQFIAGFTLASDFLHQDLIFLNPRPNPGKPVFLNTFYQGRGYLAGGCMGCHGSRQAYGTDWSFTLYRGRVMAPETKP